jgi:hypothetical protein
LKFGGHTAGGIISATGVTSAYLIYAASGSEGVNIFPVLRIFLITFFFSLFPDLDVSSIPQRWFYRVIFLLLIFLGYLGEFEIATIVAVLAITPILDHHHGWTHNAYSPVIVPIFLILIYHIVLLKNPISFELFGIFIKNYLWIFLACSLGWYTHLFLDMRLPFLKNSRNHL